jgi:hypothetical protein
LTKVLLGSKVNMSKLVGRFLRESDPSKESLSREALCILNTSINAPI